MKVQFWLSFFVDLVLIKMKTVQITFFKAQIRHLELPQHLDGVDQTDICVVEVVKSTKGEGRQDPDTGLGNVGDQGLEVEQAGSDVVDDNSFDAWNESQSRSSLQSNW